MNDVPQVYQLYKRSPNRIRSRLKLYQPSEERAAGQKPNTKNTTQYFSICGLAQFFETKISNKNLSEMIYLYICTDETDEYGSSCLRLTNLDLCVKE